MFCGFCGTENIDDAMYCKKCGKSLGKGSKTDGKLDGEFGESDVGKATEAFKNTFVKVKEEVSNSLKKIPKNTFILAGIAVIALIALVSIILNKKTTIDLNQYMEIKSTGYEGYGRASIVIDWEAIEKKYGNKLSFTKEAKKDYGSYINITTPVAELQDAIMVRLQDNDFLSNGNTVTYIWSVDESITKYVKCKLKYKDGSYTVSGLEKVGTFDAFTNLSVKFGGIAPTGYAELTYIGSELKKQNFVCDKINQLRNGDTVTVTIDDSIVETCATNWGKIPETMKKTYMVEGLDSYISKISDVDKEALEKMQKQASDAFDSYRVTWADTTSLKDFSYIGSYLITQKSDLTYGDVNILYLIYKVRARNTYTNSSGQSYDKINSEYWYISYSNLIMGADGKLKFNVMDYSSPQETFQVDSGVPSGWWSTYTWTYRGFESLDKMYESLITSRKELYNHEELVNDTANIEEKDSTKTSDSADEAEIISMPKVGADILRDLTDPSDFVKAESPDGAYTFQYPKNYFKTGTYNAKTKTYSFTASDGITALTIETLTPLVPGNAQASAQAAYDEKIGDFLLDNALETPYERGAEGVSETGWSRSWIGGYLKNETAHGRFILNVANNDSLYRMTIDYKTSGTKGIGAEGTQAGYLFNCLYRGWSLSGSSYEIESFEAYRKTN